MWLIAKMNSPTQAPISQARVMKLLVVVKAMTETVTV